MARFGAFLPSFEASAPVRSVQLRKIAARAEELRYAHVWVGDHFVWNVGMLAPLATLAHVAAATATIRLGCGVYLLPLRHPTVAAKDVASVDVLSDGRLILGVGVGGDDPKEYEAVGVDCTARGARIDEGIGQLRSLLAQEQVPLKGRFASAPAITIAPPPVQDSVPIWVGGRAQAVVERAASMGDGWFPVWVSPRRFAEAREQIIEQRGGAEGFAFALNIFSTVDESKESARSVLGRHMQSAYGLPFERFEKYAAFGSADDIAEALSAYVDAGVTDFALNLAGPDPEGQLEELAKVVATLDG